MEDGGDWEFGFSAILNQHNLIFTAEAQRTLRDLFALDLYYSAREVKAAGLKRQHSEWSTEKISQKVREIFLYAGTY